MTTRPAPTCLGCSHFQGIDSKGGFPRCSSFPKGIPDDIWRHDDPHITSRNGEATYQPKDVAAVAIFVAEWVLPVLNPALVPRWLLVARKLVDLRRAAEDKPKPKPKKAS